VDWIRAAVAPKGTPGDPNVTMAAFNATTGFPNFNPKDVQERVRFTSHATGAVTSAFSVHVVFEEYYPPLQEGAPSDGDSGAGKGGGTGGGKGGKGGKGDADSLLGVDLVLVDHTANDMSLRTSYVSEDVVEEVKAQRGGMHVRPGGLRFGFGGASVSNVASFSRDSHLDFPIATLPAKSAMYPGRWGNSRARTRPRGSRRSA